jgi:hypothetical protein
MNRLRLLNSELTSEFRTIVFIRRLHFSWFPFSALNPTRVMAKRCRGSPRASTLARITRAAEMRAGGSSWPAIAKALSCSPRVCTRWPTDYPDLWAQLYAEALAERDDAAEAESIRALRAMLRQADVKLQREAARDLLRILQARDQRQRPVTDQPHLPCGIDDHERLEALLDATAPDDTLADGHEADSINAGAE